MFKFHVWMLLCVGVEESSSSLSICYCCRLNEHWAKSAMLRRCCQYVLQSQRPLDKFLEWVCFSDFVDIQLGVSSFWIVKWNSLGNDTPISKMVPSCRWTFVFWLLLTPIFRWESQQVPSNYSAIFYSCNNTFFWCWWSLWQRLRSDYTWNSQTTIWQLLDKIVCNSFFYVEA